MLPGCIVLSPSYACSMAVAVEQELCAPGVAQVLGRIPEWWERRAAAAGLPPEWRHWDLALGAPPVALEIETRLLDESAYQIGEAYVAALEPSTRSRHGQHFTPELLAEELWREILAITPTHGRIVDPAVGAGALLIHPLRSFVQTAHDPAQALRKASSFLGGTDLDPIAVWLGNAFLAAELLPLWEQLPPERREPLPKLLCLGDGLTSAGDDPHIILMNPPYGRTRLSASARQRWQATLYGHANRYALFLQAAVERVSPGGVIGAVIPTSFLGGSYFQRLRAYLAREAPLVRLTFVESRAGVFAGDVLQETCLAIFRKGARSSDVTCAQVAINGNAARVELPRVHLPRVSEGRPWLLPRRPGDRGLIEKASQLESRLSDYGWKVSTGPLVWNRHKQQIRPERRGGAVPILWAADLESRNVRRSAARESQRWIVLRAQDAFMRQTEPALLVQRTTAPEQPRRLVVATLDRPTVAEWGGVVVVENHVNILRSHAKSVLSPNLLEGLLNTATFDRLYRCLTGSVAVSAYELEALPMPARDVLRSWANLSDAELEDAVADYFDG